jgi:prenyltransferase beta subunit
MATGFLEALDARLAAGYASLGRASAELTRGFVLSQQTPEGGFHGRRNAADLYYTDFALRLLNLTGVEARPLQAAAGYLGRPGACGDVVSAFGLLNGARLLKGRGIEVPLDCGAIGLALIHQRLPDGSFSHSNESQPSAYQTFLAALVCEVLCQPMKRIQAAARAIAGLRCPDGGYSDRPGEKTGQTNSTAAALAFLTQAGALPARDAADAVSFLTRLQDPDGGLRAHAAAPAGDLLSTFTGLVALSGFGALDRLQIGRAHV